jgi:inhibitor of cysteine peptidase
MDQSSLRTRARHVLLVVTLLAVAALLVGCSSDDDTGGNGGGGNDGGGSASTFTPKSGETIDVAADKPFEVRLESNPTTGYSWTVESIDGTVKFVESVYEAPKGGAAGAPGEQVLTFDAGPAGTSTVLLAYERPFAPDEPGESLEFEVDVQKG